MVVNDDLKGDMEGRGGGLFWGSNLPQNNRPPVLKLNWVVLKENSRPLRSVSAVDTAI
jgi:hypothetical protein